MFRWKIPCGPSYLQYGSDPSYTMRLLKQIVVSVVSGFAFYFVLAFLLIDAAATFYYGWRVRFSSIYRNVGTQIIPTRKCL